MPDMMHSKTPHYLKGQMTMPRPKHFLKRAKEVAAGTGSFPASEQHAEPSLEVFFEYFTGFPAGTVQIRGHQQLQQEISKLSVLVTSQMDITSCLFGRFKVPP